MYTLLRDVMRHNMPLPHGVEPKSTMSLTHTRVHWNGTWVMIFLLGLHRIIVLSSLANILGP
jgi:hypothetical protein